MSVLVVCYRCKQSVDIKKTALCSVCNHRFEPDCDGYPAQTYKLMDAESKNKWRCKACIKKPTACSMNISHGYVLSKMETRSSTRLALKNQKTKSVESLNETFTSTSSEIFAKSLPDLSTEHNSYISELQEEINALKQQLVLADSKIEELTIETISLKKERDEQQSQILNLKKMCSGINSTTKTGIKGNKNCQPRPLITENIRSETIHQQIEQHDITPPTTTPIEDLDLIPNGQNYQSPTKPSTFLEDTSMSKESVEQLQPTATSMQDVSSKRRVLIFGGQQCIGLASQLINSRKNNNSENYEISAQTKPFATSDEIIKGCENLKLGKYDKIILGIGENDTNPMKVVIELSVILKKFEHNTVIIVNVCKNKYLSTKMLNDTIKLTCNNFSNCYFMNVFHTYHNRIVYTCKKLNFFIDSLDYNAKYLPMMSKEYITNQKLTHINSSQNHKIIPFIVQQPIIKQKTILDFFPKVRHTTPPQMQPGSGPSVNITDLTFFRE